MFMAFFSASKFFLKADGIVTPFGQLLYGIGRGHLLSRTLKTDRWTDLKNSLESLSENGQASKRQQGT